MKRRRCWARGLGFAISFFFGLFLVILSPDEIARRTNREETTTTSNWSSTPYYRHIKFIDNRHLNDTNSTSSLLSSSWQQSYNSDNVRISFELHDPQTVPLENVFNPYVTCPLGRISVGKKKQIPTRLFRSGELPPSLKRVVNQQDMYGRSRTGRVLDFTVRVRTNLKLLFIGDSVMVQLAQAFDEMVGGVEMQSRKVLWDTWKGHEGGAVTAPTRGGGVSALWRMTGLLSRANRGKPPPNSAGGGWSDTEIDLLTNYSYDPIMTNKTEDPPLQQQQQQNPRNATTTTVTSFDVVILRVMHGWMSIHEITHARLIEAVELSHTVFRATTVVIMTVPFTNNVQTIEDMIKVNEINEDIRNIARDWHSIWERKVGGLRHVLVVEYGSYYNHIIWSNGLHLGYNVTHPLRATQHDFDTEGPGLLLDRLQHAKWPPSIPMVCNDTSLLGPDRRTCHRNYLFLDGMHVCPETLASRFAAGVACLVGCVYNTEQSTNREHNEEQTSFPTEHDVRACEKECNEQFFSVMPVEESWLETTMASSAG